MRPRRGTLWSKLALLALPLLLSTGCVSQLATSALGDLLGNLRTTLASDEDPELVRDALPLALELSEAMILSDPDSVELHIDACSGFVQYAYAFVETDALLLESQDPRGARQLEKRALKLYQRALGYCRGGLELHSPGLSERLFLSPETAAEELGADDVDLIYWTAAAWGSAIAQGLSQPGLVADLPVVRALVDRGLEVDESYQDGAFHGAAIGLAALPETLGGSVEAARFHFQRAIELTGGQSAGPYITLARGVAVGQQDVSEFRQLLDQALAIDPDAAPGRRLENLIAQRQAEALRDREEDFFFELEPNDEF